MFCVKQISYAHNDRVKEFGSKRKLLIILNIFRDYNGEVSTRKIEIVE